MSSTFTSFQSALKDVFTATFQTENELNRRYVAMALGCLLQLYAHVPLFATHQQRLTSFGELNRSLQNTARGLTPMELANVGFFHTGWGDEAVCGTCFLGLRDWQPSDADAEAVHARFAGAGRCLFLATRQLLISTLPLARKHLAPPSPTSPLLSTAREIDRVVERLTVIASQMSSGNCWPVENARTLAYTDDLIVLALWRLQSEKTGDQVGQSGWAIDSQGTTDLLKAILRVQESGYGDEEEPITTERHTDVAESNGDCSSPPEDSELECLSLRSRSSVSRPAMPCLSQMLVWWRKSIAYEQPLPTYAKSIALRKKAHSTST